ncbi:hypothetical protein B0H14DRAFT_2576663 [Mycena olivaceomarginata]|nr:hypothetical protein B0H14DRAFT_2576663 [Mycena olivaceomarginata]
MPAMNNTMDDASPLIKYLPEGAWTQNFSAEAHANTYTWTDRQDASATFQFWGTSITVKGLRNEWHGGYTVSLNGENFPMNGSMPYPGEWKATIFAADNLPPGQYTLVISNDGWSTLDIDSITWSCNIGGRSDTNSSLQNTTVDDTESAFSWSGSWDQNPSNLSRFRPENWAVLLPPNLTPLSTTHFRLIGISVDPMKGDAVAIYGTAGPGHSRYSVLPPGRSPQQFDAARGIPSSQVLMYFGDRFGPGNHTVTLVNDGPGLFQIDYAVCPYYEYSDYERPPELKSQRYHHPSRSGPYKPRRTFFLLQRNKTLWYRLQRGYKVQSQFDAGTPPNGSVTPLPFSAPPPPMRSKSYLLQRDDDDDFEAEPLNRAVTMESHLTASTLVADPGSKPPSPLFVEAGVSPSPHRLHISIFSPQEESQFYDPHAAAVAGLDEIPEDSIEEVLRHPIRRNEPSMPTYQHWQAGLP